MPNLFETLLIVEDDDGVRFVLEQTLKDLFSKIILASDGEVAKQIMLSEPCSLVISDINMPNLTGIEFVQHLRASGVHTPVMFMTGNQDRNILLSAVRLGVVDVVEKPFDSQTIKDKVERILEIEKRKEAIQLAQASGGDVSSDNSKLSKEKKMLGLLQVKNLKK